MVAVPRRHINMKTFYTEQSVPGSERTPNTNLSVLPLYVDGKKYDTRIPGIEVIPNSKEVLVSLYAKATELCDKYGTDVYYNEFVKQNIKFRWDIVNKHEETWAIEDEIGVGQMEELIQHARDDIETIYDYNEIIIPSEDKVSELGSDDDDLSDDITYDSRLGEQGIWVTLDNYDELLANNPEPTEEQLDTLIAKRVEMDNMMAEREIEAEAGAKEHEDRNATQGGGWRMGG